MNDIIDELAVLLANGLEFENRALTVKLQCVICDAPARAMVKGTKLYAGYYGCDKCSQKGVYDRKVTYPDIGENRTDETFRNMSQEGHHNGPTPFTRLPIDMIKTFPVDYMHHTCLGVVKRLILVWIRGPKRTRMSAQHVTEINERLHSLKQFVPKEFARKPRGLNEVDYWKATEYRQFLLYTSRFALKGILATHLYDHFMCLSVAVHSGQPTACTEPSRLCSSTSGMVH